MVKRFVHGGCVLLDAGARAGLCGRKVGDDGQAQEAAAVPLVEGAGDVGDERGASAEGAAGVLDEATNLLGRDGFLWAACNGRSTPRRHLPVSCL